MSKIKKSSLQKYRIVASGTSVETDYIPSFHSLHDCITDNIWDRICFQEKNHLSDLKSELRDGMLYANLKIMDGDHKVMKLKIPFFLITEHQLKPSDHWFENDRKYTIMQGHTSRSPRHALKPIIFNLEDIAKADKNLRLYRKGKNYKKKISFKPT